FRGSHTLARSCPVGAQAMPMRQHPSRLARDPCPGLGAVRHGIASPGALRVAQLQQPHIAAGGRDIGGAYPLGAERARVWGDPAFGPVPERPSPPKGWTPTTAPIWLRLT